MVERRTENPCVASSILALGTKTKSPTYVELFVLVKIFEGSTKFLLEWTRMKKESGMGEKQNDLHVSSDTLQQNRVALEALDDAKTREEKRAIIDKLGGLPVDPFRGVAPRFHPMRLHR